MMEERHNKQKRKREVKIIGMQPRVSATYAERGKNREIKYILEKR